MFGKQNSSKKYVRVRWDWMWYKADLWLLLRQKPEAGGFKWVRLVYVIISLTQNYEKFRRKMAGKQSDTIKTAQQNVIKGER